MRVIGLKVRKHYPRLGRVGRRPDWLVCVVINPNKFSYLSNNKVAKIF